MNHDNTKTPCPHKALSVLARTLESQRRQSILPLRDLIGQKAALLVSHLSTAYAVHSFLTDSPSSFLSLTICLTSLDLFYHPFTNFSLFPPPPPISRFSFLFGLLQTECCCSLFMCKTNAISISSFRSLPLCSPPYFIDEFMKDHLSPHSLTLCLSTSVSVSVPCC